MCGRSPTSATVATSIQRSGLVSLVSHVGPGLACRPWPVVTDHIHSNRRKNVEAHIGKLVSVAAQARAPARSSPPHGPATRIHC